MPVLDGEAWIEPALRSVTSQTRLPDELIIVNDGCTDGTMGIVERMWRPWFRVVDGPGVGLAAALRLGVEEARGDLIARLDQDDIAHADRLRRQETVFDDDAISICGSWSRYVGGRGVRHHFAPPLSPAAVARFAGLGNPFVHSATMFRRTRVLEAGNYQSPSKRSYPEDYDLWIRLLERGQGVNLRTPLVQYRVHPGSISTSDSALLGSAAARLAERARQRVLGLGVPQPTDCAIIRTYHGVREIDDRYTPMDLHRFFDELSSARPDWPSGLSIPWTTKTRLLKGSLRSIAVSRRTRTSARSPERQDHDE